MQTTEKSKFFCQFQLLQSIKASETTIIITDNANYTLSRLTFITLRQCFSFQLITRISKIEGLVDFITHIV